MGIMMSLSAAKYLLVFFLFPYAWVLGTLAIIPTLVDSVLQEFYNVISNNRRRAITGLFCGLGMAVILEALHHGV